jgi:uncharacterized protein
LGIAPLFTGGFAMILTTYQNPSEFLAATHAVLSQTEAINNLLIGLALRLQSTVGQWQSTPYFVVVRGDDDQLTFGLSTSPQNALILYSQGDDLAAVDAIIADLQAAARPLPGVIGLPATAQVFAKQWAAQSGDKYHLRTLMGVYELRSVTPPTYAAAGHMANAKAEDIEVVLEWSVAMEREIHPEAEPDREIFRASLSRRIAAGDIYFWYIEGQTEPVTQAAKGRDTLTGAVVNLVYTPPALRGKGYATACVAALSAHLLAEGVAFCALFTDMQNPISNSIYQKMGYRYVSPYEEYAFVGQ